jgi:hypothetical protein
MTCARCSDLCVTYWVHSPRELEKALAIAISNLRDGTTEEIALPPESPTLERKVSFASVAAGIDRPDFVNFKFRCTSCGETFALVAETYHGSGGSWRPEREGASRESL